jgi:5-methylcytosine-specific restriction endonuclease McrBC regulatory subunit McrC
MSLIGGNVSNLDKGKYLWYQKKQFGLRPDIVMTKGYRIIILDIK